MELNWKSTRLPLFEHWNLKPSAPHTDNNKTENLRIQREIDLRTIASIPSEGLSVQGQDAG